MLLVVVVLLIEGQKGIHKHVMYMDVKGREGKREEEGEKYKGFEALVCVGEGYLERKLKNGGGAKREG